MQRHDFNVGNRSSASDTMKIFTSEDSNGPSKGPLQLHHIVYHGFFQALCHNTVFVFQIEFEGLFSCRRHEEISRESAECCKPPVGIGQSPGGDQEAKHREAQCIWTLRIFYFSSNSVIFC